VKRHSPVLGNNQLGIRQSKVAIRGPAGDDTVLLDDDQAVTVRQGKRLIPELLRQPNSLGHFITIEWHNIENRERVYEIEKLDGSIPVVSPQKPAMPFRDDQCRGYQQGRVGKKPAKQGVMRIRAVQEGD
jgi:hypothetical protein